MSQSLIVFPSRWGSAALPSGSSLTRVHEVLESFAARDHSGETLTAIRHFPAREAWSTKLNGAAVARELFWSDRRPLERIC